MKTAILNCYSDEPTCLNVPPTFGPQPRYIAGALVDAGVSLPFFLTIDQLRKNPKLADELNNADLLVIIAGMVVPGKYLAGNPATAEEIRHVLSRVPHPFKVLAGPAARYGFGFAGGHRSERLESVFDFVCNPGDEELLIHNLVKEKLDPSKVDRFEKRNYSCLSKWALLGAPIVKQQPGFPDALIAEMETYRGCTRVFSGGCSFCIEPSKGLPEFRATKDIVAEVAALYHLGIRAFRLGDQPDLYCYEAFKVGEIPIPIPNPDAIEKLYRGVREAAPDLKVLHLDNVNPEVLVRWPEECREITKTIVRYNTPGDIAAFGIESVDPVVIKKNNLKVDAADAIKAISLINEIGAVRQATSLPKLLPGLNFVLGLEGETRSTFDQNLEFLQDVLSRGLLVRRINLRQVMPLPKTRMYAFGEKLARRHHALFLHFKHLVRKQVDGPMLRRVAPVGTELKDVYAEMVEGGVTFGRQLASYPILVGIPAVLPLHRVYNVKVVDYGFRSLTGVPVPLPLNTAPRSLLETLPGVGSKRAATILRYRPFKDWAELEARLPETNLKDFVTLT